jgi:hypothetical protein
MAQRRAQIVGDRITERLELQVDGLQFGGTFDDALLKGFVETLYFICRVFPLRDVTDVALNHLFVAGLIHVADKLHGNAAAIARFQWQIFIPDTTWLDWIQCP